MSPVPPTPVQLEPQNMALFGSRVSADVIKLKSQRVMLNERGPLTQHDQRLYKKAMWRQPHRGEGHMMLEARLMLLQVREPQGSLAAPRARKEAGNQP